MKKQKHIAIIDPHTFEERRTGKTTVRALTAIAQCLSKPEGCSIILPRDETLSPKRFAEFVRCKIEDLSLEGFSFCVKNEDMMLCYSGVDIVSYDR